MLNKNILKTPELRTKLRRVLVFGLLATACSMFFMFTAPGSVSSVLLLLGFMLLGVMIYSILSIVMIVSGLETAMRPSRRRTLMIGATMLPVLALMMQSIGQLTSWDIATLAGLFVVGMFYVGRLGKDR